MELLESKENCGRKKKVILIYHEAIGMINNTNENQTKIHLWKTVAEKCLLAIKHYDNQNLLSASVIEKRIEDLLQIIVSIPYEQPKPEIIYTIVKEGSKLGNKKRINVIQFNDSCGNCRYDTCEQEFNEKNEQINEIFMVTDQLMVRFKNELLEDEKAAFIQNLNYLGLWLEKVLIDEPLYLLHLTPKNTPITSTTAEDILNRMLILLNHLNHHHLIANVQPNFICSC